MILRPNRTYTVKLLITPRRSKIEEMEVYNILDDALANAHIELVKSLSYEYYADNSLQCPKCNDECSPVTKNGNRYWCCNRCGSLFNEDESEVCWSIIMEEEE